jgi:hypothetical protein
MVKFGINQFTDVLSLCVFCSYYNLVLNYTLVALGMIQCFIWSLMRICHLVILVDYFHFGMLSVCMFMCGILPLMIDFLEYCGQYYQDRPLLLLSFQRQVALPMLSVISITKFISCMWRENAMFCYVLVMIVCRQCVVDVRIVMHPFWGSIAKILLKEKVINGNKWYEWK